MSEAILKSLAISLALTVILEAGFFLLSGKRNKKDLLLVLLVNVLTNPIVVLLYWLTTLYTDLSATLAVIPLEIIAVFAEGHYFRKYGQEFKRPYLFSLAANAFSFTIGAVLNML